MPMKWIIQLEPGVWLAPWDGDPGRTLCRENADCFTSRVFAGIALVCAREYRPFTAAKVEREQ